MRKSGFIRGGAIALVLFGLSAAGGGGVPAGAAPTGPLFPLAGSDLGGFGGPDFRLTSLQGSLMMVGGGPVYLLAGRSWLVGLNGYYLEGDAQTIMIGYLGASVGTLLFPRSWASLAFSVLAGGGDASVNSGARHAGLLVLEPDVEVLFALTRTAKIGLGASYRLALPLAEVPGLGAADLSGLSVGLGLRYGLFGPGRKHEPPRVSLNGCFSQKFSLVRGQVARFDGGFTRLVFHRRWAVGAMGYRAADGVSIGGDSFQMMESGVWGEYLLGPGDTLSYSVGALAGVALVGTMDRATREMTGGPALLFNPQAQAYLALTEFARLSLGGGFRLAVPFAPAAGLSFWDGSGPTLSLNLHFGVF